MSTRTLLFAALLALAVPTAALAQGTPPDQVILTNGGMLRGTIIENIPGDHVTIQLPTGESRRFAASEIQSAGPAAAPAPQGPVMQAPVVPPAPPPQGPSVPQYQSPLQMSPQGPVLHVTGNRPRLTLHRQTGSSVLSVWTGRGFGQAVVESFEPICTAPCEITVPPGTYEFGVSEGEGRPQRAGHAVHNIVGPTALALEYESREALRIGGWVLFGVGTLAYLGATLALVGGDTTGSAFETGFLIATGVYLALLIPELILISFHDHADVREVGPGGTLQI